MSKIDREDRQMRKNRPGLLRASSRAAGSLLLLCTGLAGLLGTAQTPAFASAPVPATVNSPVVDLNLVDTGNVINSVSCPTSSFCMEVDGAMKFSTYNGTTWTPPAVTTLTHVLTQISCASSGVCAGVDNSTTTLYEYLTGSGWFKATTAGTGIFSTVSCASATFCMAAGAAGEAYTWVGTGMVWTSAPTGDANPITGLSCYSATFCAAVDGLGMAATYNGTAWSLVTVPVPVHTPTIVPAFSSVSCPDSGYCIAVTNTADTAGSGKDLYYVLSGSPDVWAFADTQDSNTTNTIVSVKCTQSSPTASGAFCMSVDSVGGATGDSEFFNGTSWSKPSPDDPGGIYESLSCMSPTNCFGSDSVGNIAQFNGQAWLGSEPWTNPVDSSASPAINSVSCATGTNFCVGVDPTGKAYINTGTAAWSAAASTNDINPINSVSCATTTFCLEVDNSTAYNTFNGIAWGASTAATPATLSQVSCASATLCWGVGGTGFYEFTGVWATSATVAAVALSSVSCPTSTFCMAVGAVTAGAAEAYTWTSPGTAWTATAATGGVNAFVSVSCNSGTSCVSVDGSGNVFTYSTGVWAAYASNPLDTGGPPSFDSISCATGPQLYCAAVDIQGNAFIDIAGVWTRAEPIDLGTTANLQVSCSSVAYCVAGDSIGDFLILAGSPSSLPSPPTASAAGASGSLNVTWSSPALPLGFGGVPASSATYVISIENVTTPSITDVSAVSSPYTASSLVNGSQYVFCIASVNPVGISPTSCSTPATPTGLPGGVVIVGSTGVCTVGAKPTALTTIPPIPSTLTGNGNASAFADMGPFYLCVTDANGYAVRATSSVTVGFFAFNGGNFASGTVFSGSAYGPPLTSVGGLESVTIAASSDVSSAVYFGASQAGASYTIWANAPGQFTPQCGLGGGGYGCAIVAADVATGSSAIGTPTVVVTPNTAGSTAASYTFTFVANSALNPGTDFILLDASTGAAGTAFPSTAADYVITDFTHASGSGTVFTAPFPYDAGATVAVPISSPIVAGDDIQLQISSVTNPTSPGLADSINVSTTQDAIPQATNKYSIGAGSTM
ncbi:MAG TPA: fibronectin type III domain-containing protein, partial [Acidimicrobiales bacterium]|nr:fibronectin type III domain-containing protein [Acidimicrobiales bacterium]